MTAIEFLREELSKLALKFPSVKIKYAYSIQTDQHVVELTPQSEYYYNEDLDLAWVPISLEFKALFKSQDIIFVSSDSILKVDNPELEWNAEVDLFDLSEYNQFISALNKMVLNYDFPSEMLTTAALPNSALLTEFFHTQISHVAEEYSYHKVTYKESTRPCQTKSQSNILSDDEFPLAA